MTFNTAYTVLRGNSELEMTLRNLGIIWAINT